MTHRILVATDMGSEAGHALTRVLDIARRRADTEVHVLRVCFPGDSESRAAAALADRIAAHTADVPDVRPIVHVRTSPSVVAGICDAAKELGAEIVAVGSRGGQLLGGGIAEGLLDVLDASLLVVRPDRRHAGASHDGRVLVGVDFSAPARRALELAASLRGDAEVALVHIVEGDVHARPRLPRPEPDATLEALRARLEAWGAPLAQHVIVERGDIGATLATIAEREHASLVAVGARGARDEVGPVAASAAARLIHSASVPVLVVR